MSGHTKRQAGARRRGWCLIGAALAAFAWLVRSMPAGTPGREYWPWGVVAGVLLVAVIVGNAIRRAFGSAGVIGRWSRRSKRNDGVASSWSVWWHASAFAMWRKATVWRPSLRRRGLLGWWHRLTIPAIAVATPVARVGWQRVWSSVEDVTLRIGGPRTGKTGELCGRILDARGAVIATSTRTDIVDITRAVRAKRGPVYVFNPAGLGGLASTITFDPITGCTNPQTAADRAADLLSGGAAPGADGGDRQFWIDSARRVLTALLHAAALGDLGMRDVLAWVSVMDDDTQRTVLDLLRRSTSAAHYASVEQFFGTNDRTRTSITASIMPALDWLTNDAAVAAATQQSGRSTGFDVAELLAQRGTVYMLGAQNGQTAPLVTALTAHIARTARDLAAGMPSGRLDPPLTLVLDEAALICPVPLDEWTADMGGRNVTIHIGAQSRAQLRQRFGADGAAVILTNAATLMLFGGTKDADDLGAFSVLTGHRYEEQPNYNEDGPPTGSTARAVPVLSPGQLAQLPAGRVAIIKRGMPPVIGRVRMAWKRADVKAARRAEQWTEFCELIRCDTYRARIVARQARYLVRTVVWPALLTAGRWLAARAATAWASTTPNRRARHARALLERETLNAQENVRRLFAELERDFTEHDQQPVAEDVEQGSESDGRWTR